MLIFINQQKLLTLSHSTDFSNLSAKVPQINNSISVNILKLPGDQSNKLFNKQKLSAISLINTQNHPQNHSSITNIHTPTKKKQSSKYPKINNSKNPKKLSNEKLQPYRFLITHTKTSLNFKSIMIVLRWKQIVTG
jgi:hypothetical protein